ncbi:MAG: hypothetical protein FWC57_03645 [Endomicrobia bacterium]|nr:hypothetical protein [Endomicrobiia bacterium]
MKKFLIVLLCCCFTLSVFKVPVYSYGSQNYEDFSEEKSKYRILIGIILVVGGGFLAYDGFRSVKVDISKPSYSILNLQSRWNVRSDGFSLWIKSRGDIVNTGNVTLHVTNMEVRYQTNSPNYYYPDQGALGNISGDSVNIGAGLTLNVNDQVYWSVAKPHTRDIMHPNDPKGDQGQKGDDDGNDNWFPDNIDSNTYAEVVNLKYTWDKKYKTQMNSPYEGIAGVVLLGAGAYLLIDYIVSLNKFEYYMKKHSMDVYVQNSSDEFRLMFSKRM